MVEEDAWSCSSTVLVDGASSEMVGEARRGIGDARGRTRRLRGVEEALRAWGIGWRATVEHELFEVELGDNGGLSVRAIQMERSREGNGRNGAGAVQVK